MAVVLTFEKMVKEPVKTIKIDGVEYPIKEVKRFGLKQQKAFVQTFNQVQELLLSEDDDDAEAIESARRKMDWFIKQVVPTITDEALDWLSDDDGVVDEELGDNQKLQIMELFISASAETNKKQPPAPRSKKK